MQIYNFKSGGLQTNRLFYILTNQENIHGMKLWTKTRNIKYRTQQENLWQLGNLQKGLPLKKQRMKTRMKTSLFLEYLSFLLKLRKYVAKIKGKLLTP